MTNRKIVADSSANLMKLRKVTFAAASLKAMIEAELPEVTVKIGKNLGLCSYYAERGGMLVGYEKF